MQTFFMLWFGVCEEFLRDSHNLKFFSDVLIFRAFPSSYKSLCKKIKANF